MNGSLKTKYGKSETFRKQIPSYVHSKERKNWEHYCLLSVVGITKLRQRTLAQGQIYKSTKYETR